MTTPFWTNDPTILLNQDNITEVWPLTSMDYEQKLNAIFRTTVSPIMEKVSVFKTAESSPNS